MFLIFDTETTGLPNNYKAPLDDFDNWPRMVQLAWQIHDKHGAFVEAKNYIIKPVGFEIPYKSVQVHGITTEKAFAEGQDLKEVLKKFSADVETCQFIVGHNVEFDLSIVGSEFLRAGIPNFINEREHVCTKIESTDFCSIPGGKGRKFKWPTLSELHQKLFNEDFEEAHNASADVVATARSFLELVRARVITADRLKMDPVLVEEFIKANKEPFKPVEISIESNVSVPGNGEPKETPEVEIATVDEDQAFVHLHVHTQFSILDGAADIPGLVKKAKKDGMKALAITDHGNMFGAKLFHKLANKEGVKPILGCEVYVARRHRKEKEDKIDGSGYHLVLLAKNMTGYHNLIKMVSYGWLEGFYYNPRVDKELLHEYHEGIIATSACLGGELPKTIMNEGVEAGEKVIREFQEIFGEDYYIEIQRHPTSDPNANQSVYKDQQYVNKVLLELAQKHGVKVVATNDIHFIEPEDAEAQDRLLCISTNKDVNDTGRIRYTRQEWMKTQQEMRELFADVPEVMANTIEIANKVEEYPLGQDPIMPEFSIPEGFEDADAYLRHITYEGAKNRWGDELVEDIRERLDFELETIKNMGFPSYFLIVWDFLKAARELGVSVGPGRGSAAGSAVAYSLRITEIDPIKYKLLFERFLNPDRISMPDIDIDFDEDGRAKILEWVVNKYGPNRVAHIITFGSMAAKSSIRDVARVQGLPLPEADRLAKLVPEKPGTSLKDAFAEVRELKKEKESGSPEIASVLKYAETLEGSVRNIGTHACGIIIGREDLENYIPISTTKDSELTYVTQFDGNHVEDVGLLKMDFLGLKTLSIIKDAVQNVKLSKGINIDIENLPLDDEKTYELYSKGETTGLFQFESDGMKKYLKALKPTQFEDLIAMNALYRPGPMEYIPEFVNRKHGKAKIEYDFPIMEEVLKETYGITVYQEQVMLLSRLMAGFTRGQADSLRKAMGKKIQSMMDDLKPKFIEGCKEKHGFEEEKVLKVWNDWEKFASYAFNKSHATCYSYVSYQTAYLKAHYPAEFMAAVLSRNLNDIKKVTFFMDECRRMGMKVLGPDVNESHWRFMVNQEGHIRFGLAAIKGVGGSAVESIVNERQENGPYKDVYDFIERVNLQQVNRKTMEALAISGALDCFHDIQRYQYFGENEKGQNYIELLLRFGNKLKAEKNGAPTLFGEPTALEIPRPPVPDVEPWSPLGTLNRERELIGIYISAHPLDEFKFELDNICNTPLSAFRDLDSLKGKEIMMGGMVTSASERTTKNGRPYGVMTLEDYIDSHTYRLFGQEYLDFKKYFEAGYFLLIKGRVQEKGWGDNEHELEFKVKDMQMLADAKESHIRSVSLNLNIEDLDEALIQEIEDMSNKYKGKVLLKFHVLDPESNVRVNMFSRNLRVDFSNDFINYLESLPDVAYKVN